MSSTRGQSAWEINNTIKNNPSETTRSAFNSGNTKYKATNKDVSMFGQSIPYELGQPMKVGMANATIDQANSEISFGRFTPAK